MNSFTINIACSLIGILLYQPVLCAAAEPDPVSVREVSAIFIPVKALYGSRISPRKVLYWAELGINQASEITTRDQFYLEEVNGILRTLLEEEPEPSLDFADEAFDTRVVIHFKTSNDRIYTMAVSGAIESMWLNVEHSPPTREELEKLLKILPVFVAENRKLVERPRER